LMGARFYNPVRGLFTSLDPVPGGNDTAYNYPGDPINSYDLDGRMRCQICGIGGSGGAVAGVGATYATWWWGILRPGLRGWRLRPWVKNAWNGFHRWWMNGKNGNTKKNTSRNYSDRIEGKEVKGDNHGKNARKSTQGNMKREASAGREIRAEKKVTIGAGTRNGVGDE
jgi:hypothetical protein